MTLPEIKNNRYIQYGDDTVIGYDFPNQKFYVINKDTKTTRNTAEQIVSVLHALGITDYTAEDLNSTIKNTIETLGTPLLGTLEDNGSYIRTIQFNEWIDYPLTVDCEKENIYIKNTNISFSLKIDESPDRRASEFCNYYYERLGLQIDKNFMRGACELLANQYDVPSFYNVLSKDAQTNVLKYTGSFDINNFNNESSITCNGANNPNNTFSNNNKEGLGQIQSIDNENDLITLKEAFPIPEGDEKFFSAGFQVSITGTTYEQDGATYTADGTYTINQVFKDGENKIESIQVNEPITASYEYPYPTCYVKSASHNIYSMKRENNVIKVEAQDFPSSLITGSKIHVENAIAGDGYGTIDLSGLYTVQNISTQIKQISDTVIEMGPDSNNKNLIVISTPTTDLKVGDVLQISGTNTADDNISYTIKETPVSSTNSTTLYVEESIPYSYGQTTGGTIDVELTHNDATGENLITLPQGLMIVVNPQDLIKVNNATFTVLKVTRVDNRIVLTVGETVSTSTIIGASVTLTSMNPVSLTSQTIMYYNIYVEEEILTDFVSTSSQQATFSQEDFVSKITGINKTGEQITLEGNSSDLLTEETLYIYTNINRYERTIEGIRDNVITLNEALNEGMPNPKLELLKPDTETMLSITEVQGDLSNIVPLGDFVLDTFAQCQAYVTSLQELEEDSKIPSLNDSINEKMYTYLDEGDEIGNFEITLEEDTSPTEYSVKFKGLYSEVYPS